MEIRRVTGVSSVTAEAGNPVTSMSGSAQTEVSRQRANVAGKDKEVIVGKSAMLDRINELANMQPIPALILGLQNFHSVAVV